MPRKRNAIAGDVTSRFGKASRSASWLAVTWLADLGRHDAGGLVLQLSSIARDRFTSQPAWYTQDPAMDPSNSARVVPGPVPLGFLWSDAIPESQRFRFGEPSDNVAQLSKLIARSRSNVGKLQRRINQLQYNTRNTRVLIVSAGTVV